MDNQSLLQLKLRPDGVRLEIESLSDTGNAVPVGISLQAPQGLLIQSFEIFAPENPVQKTLKIKLGTPQNTYRFDTRIRLALTQDVWVIAKLSDGTLIGSHAPTVLTSSACFDAS